MIVTFVQTTQKSVQKTDWVLAALVSLYEKLEEQILKNDTNYNKFFIKVKGRHKKMNVS